jgi:sulfatase modifying factor 1
MKTIFLIVCAYCTFSLYAQDIKTITVHGVSFDMIRVEGGTFNMGCTLEQEIDCGKEENPVHQTTVSSFYIGKFEVTQKLHNAVRYNSPQNYDNGLPVNTIEWFDCQEFIEKLNQLTGIKFCLPTEAQWEYAARGGNKSKGYKYSGSNNLDDVAWYKDNSNDMSHIVGTKQPNELGIYDMSGNVWEWCKDWYGIYISKPQNNPQGVTSSDCKVLRGGSNGADHTNCRVSFRTFDRSWDDRYYDNYGFVLLKTWIEMEKLTKP